MSLSNKQSSVLPLVLIFNYQVTNLPNYQILGENKDIGTDNKNNRVP